MTHPAARKKASPEDWHPADIIAALRKQGWSLAQLSLHHGYKDRGSLRQALAKPYPKAERIIAKTLGLPPKVIWPTRYNADGTTARRGNRPRRPEHVPPVRIGERAGERNLQEQAAA